MYMPIKHVLFCLTKGNIVLEICYLGFPKARTFVFNLKALYNIFLVKLIENVILLQKHYLWFKQSWPHQ